MRSEGGRRIVTVWRKWKGKWKGDFTREDKGGRRYAWWREKVEEKWWVYEEAWIPFSLSRLTGLHSAL